MIRLSVLGAALLSTALAAAQQTATFNFAAVNQSYSAFLAPDDPLVGKEVVAARIYLSVETFPNIDAANFYTDISFPIQPLPGNTNALVLTGVDAGWSGSGIFSYFRSTTEFNGTFVAARYGAASPQDLFEGHIVPGSRIEIDYIPEPGSAALLSASLLTLLLRRSLSWRLHFRPGAQHAA